VDLHQGNIPQPHGVQFNGMEPPTDRLELLRMRRLYYQTVLDNESAMRAQYLHACQEQANGHLNFPEYCPPPPDNFRDVLNRGADRIHKLQMKLHEIDVELHEIDPHRKIEEQRVEKYRAHRESAQRLVNELNSYS
jgi:hypothetical protein